MHASRRGNHDRDRVSSKVETSGCIRPTLSKVKRKSHWSDTLFRPRATGSYTTRVGATVVRTRRTDGLQFGTATSSRCTGPSWPRPPCRSSQAADSDGQDGLKQRWQRWPDYYWKA